mmetsp:Transcript_7840/g.17540  ORF Transcript_7840/g.17540 Transcript_7840/m.17540 type:complete len:201 (-) Transcript_7840:527-1129(-)
MRVLALLEVAVVVVDMERRLHLGYLKKVDEARHTDGLQRPGRGSSPGPGPARTARKWKRCWRKGSRVGGNNCRPRPPARRSPRNRLTLQTGCARELGPQWEILPLGSDCFRPSRSEWRRSSGRRGTTSWKQAAKVAMGAHRQWPAEPLWVLVASPSRLRCQSLLSLSRSPQPWPVIEHECELALRQKWSGAPRPGATLRT